MTYGSLNNCKDELTLSYSITTEDTELANLLSIIDNYINTRLQMVTSLPLQSELQIMLADIEARWVAARFRFRRATPQEQQQYQDLLNNIEQEFQVFISNNFKTSFKGVGRLQNQPTEFDYGRWGVEGKS